MRKLQFRLGLVERRLAAERLGEFEPAVVIHDNRIGSVLFIGRVQEPKARRGCPYLLALFRIVIRSSSG
jgi:hypothetical protein